MTPTPRDPETFLAAARSEGVAIVTVRCPLWPAGVTVDAVQVTGTNPAAVADWCGGVVHRFAAPVPAHLLAGGYYDEHPSEQIVELVRVPTYDGHEYAETGDWVTRRPSESDVTGDEYDYTVWDGAAFARTFGSGWSRWVL